VERIWHSLPTQSELAQQMSNPKLHYQICFCQRSLGAGAVTEHFSSRIVLRFASGKMPGSDVAASSGASRIRPFSLFPAAFRRLFATTQSTAASKVRKILKSHRLWFAALGASPPAA
jgi:hypothetical protein